MIHLSSITNAISNVAHSAAVHAKNLCVDSRVDAVFRATIGAVQAHPYIALLGTGVALYCCRNQVGGLVNKVKEAAQFLYTKATGSMASLINLLRRSPEAMETPSNESILNNARSPALSSTPSVDEPDIAKTGTDS